MSGLLAVAAACSIMLFVGAASATSAANHVIYTDPAGDNQSTSSSAYASDIRQIDVTSKDDGFVTFDVTLADGPAKLVDGDELDIFIDYDRNPSTGSSGFDLDLVATGHNSTATTFTLCRYESTQYSCEVPNFDWASDTKTATGVHVVEFNLTTGVAAFDFAVIEGWTPSGGTTLTDIAPNSGVFTFSTNADPDKDGKYGTSDSCPTVRAVGKFDTNGNGCPGPFPVIRADSIRTPGGVRYPQYLQVHSVYVGGVPPGTTVSLNAPRHHAFVRANSSGIARTSRLSGNFPYGSIFTARIARPAFVGVLLKAKVTKNGPKVISRLCIPAQGGKPVKCSGKLKGS
jgi:hypothetical protein